METKFILLPVEIHLYASIRAYMCTYSLQVTTSIMHLALGPAHNPHIERYINCHLWKILSMQYTLITNS